MWLWELKDLAVIGISVLLSIVIVTQTKLMLLICLTIVTAVYELRSMPFCVEKQTKSAGGSYRYFVYCEREEADIK